MRYKNDGEGIPHGRATCARKIFSLSSALLSLGFAAGAQAVDVHPFVGLDYAETDLLIDKTTYDVIFDGGVRWAFEWPLDIEANILVPNGFYRTDYGIEYGAGVFLNYTFFRDAKISPYVGIGGSGFVAKIGCEPYYGPGFGGPTELEGCDHRETGSFGAQYRLGLKIGPHRRSKLTLAFTRTFADSKFPVMQVGIGIEAVY